MLSLQVDSTNLCGGDTVTGTAILDVLKPISMFKGIQVVLWGKERTNLSKSIQTLPPPHSESLSSSQHSAVFNISKIIQIGDSHTFIEDRILLSHKHSCSSEDIKSPRSLPSGRYTFPFRFTLPQDIPPTVQFKTFATIEYYIIAKIKLEKHGFLGLSKKSVLNKITKKNRTSCSLRVIGSLVTDKIIKRSSIITFSKKRTFALRKGKIHLTGSVPRGYAVRGEKIPVTFNIENDSSKEIKNVAVRVIRRFVVQVRDEDHKRYEEKVFYEKIGKFSSNTRLRKKEAVKGSVITCQLPDNIVPSFEGEIFSVYYDLSIVVQIANQNKLEDIIKDILVLHQSPPVPGNRNHHTISEGRPLERPPQRYPSNGNVRLSNSAQIPKPQQNTNVHPPSVPTVFHHQNDVTANEYSIPNNTNYSNFQNLQPLNYSQPIASSNVPNEPPPPAYEDLMSPVGPVPFKSSPSGRFYDLPGTPYIPDEDDEPMAPGPLNPEFYSPPQNPNVYQPPPTVPMEQKLVQVTQPDGSVVEMMGWVPVGLH